jgi:hypothetical protein
MSPLLLDAFAMALFDMRRGDYIHAGERGGNA